AGGPVVDHGGRGGDGLAVAVSETGLVHHGDCVRAGRSGSTLAVTAHVNKLDLQVVNHVFCLDEANFSLTALVLELVSQIIDVVFGLGGLGIELLAQSLSFSEGCALGRVGRLELRLDRKSVV